jgi:hypothetical protein
MNDERDDEQAELKKLLRRWEIEAPSQGLEQRLRQSFRAQAKPAMRGGRIVLPAPVAALIVVGLLLLGALAGRRVVPAPVDSRVPHESRGGGLANLKALPEVRVSVIAQGERDAQR